MDEGEDLIRLRIDRLRRENVTKGHPTCKICAYGVHFEIAAITDRHFADRFVPDTIHPHPSWQTASKSCPPPPVFHPRFIIHHYRVLPRESKVDRS